MRGTAPRRAWDETKSSGSKHQRFSNSGGGGGNCNVCPVEALFVDLEFS